jgi:zinc/manganese transport system substrate-binding protein
MLRAAALLALVVANLVRAQVARSEEAPLQARLRVVASFSILADIVRNVGGDRIEVSSIVGPGGDAHVYSPSPADAKTLAAAQLIAVNGLGFEGWIDRLIEVSATHATVVVASTGVTPRRVGASAHGTGGIDPHAWQAVGNVEIYAANVRDALIRTDPPGRAIYEANAAAYRTRLEQLDGDVRHAIAEIPPARRKVITTHDAFGYFGADYGVEFIAQQGISTETEASARDIAHIVRLIREEKIPAIFFENITDPRVLRRIAAETGARIGGTLYSDALTRPDGPAPTYIDLMRHNVGEIVAALK